LFLASRPELAYCLTALLPYCPIASPLAHRQRLRRRKRMILPVLNDDRLERLSRPEFSFADLFQACSVPIEAGLRRRAAAADRVGDRGDVAGFGIDVDRRRLAFHHRDDLPGI